jgi:beta-lactam-binding protein with PASTA domain
VTIRDGRLLLDNGYCRSTTEIVYFGDSGPHNTASCKPNEVDVPNVVGQTLAAAETRLRGQPLTPQLVYKPAAPRQRLGVVLRQYPSGGTLSSFDHVTLVLAKPLHGVVPGVVGLPVAAARARMRRARLAAVFTAADGVVTAQLPRGGVAAAPGMRVRLVVRPGSRTASRGAGTATVVRKHG